jgi:hypothetical protein
MKLFISVFLLFFSFQLIAQQPCATDQLYWQQVAQNPLILESNNKLEAQIREQLQFINLGQYAKKTTEDTTIYDVPVVVHIVHDYGADYLSDNAIYEAFKNWVDVYLGRNTDTSAVIAPFKPYIGNARIRLHLATKDPNGNPTKGVTRHQSYLANNADDQSKLDWWPNTQYVNVWFVNTFSASNNGTAAYSYYPSMGAWMPYYDGVISLASYLDVEKTIPHEIGHSMNLQHVWGNNNNAGVSCGDDQVQDTPPTKGHIGGGCTAANLYDVTCSVGYQANGINYPDTNNSQNIMDYAYCEKMFTKGQVARMRAALTANTASRNNLYTPNNLSLTGALTPMPDLYPIPDFSVEKAMFASDRSYFLCANSATKFIFTNRSWNDTITNVHWTFSNNADSATALSMDFVNNSFAQPGWVTISLSATGNNTGTISLTNTHAVYVADTNMLQPAGYAQNFATANDHNNWPYFNYFNNSFKWEWYQGKGVDDNACMRYRSFDDRVAPLNQSGTPNGDWDDLFTPGFDLTNYNNAKLNLNFYTTGAFTQGATDSMQILISVDCGRIWKRIASINGTGFGGTSSTTEFFPTSTTNWKPQTIAIPPNYLSYAKAFFKFRYFPTDNGNNLYLDKFSLSPFPTEVNEVAENRSTIKIYPNPSSGSMQLVFKTGNDGNVNIQIHDITGKTIFNTSETLSPNTVFTKEFSNIFSTNGIYFISVSNENNTVTEKMMIMK